MAARRPAPPPPTTRTSQANRSIRDLRRDALRPFRTSPERPFAPAEPSLDWRYSRRPLGQLGPREARTALASWGARVRGQTATAATGMVNENDERLSENPSQGHRTPRGTGRIR